MKKTWILGLALAGCLQPTAPLIEAARSFAAQLGHEVVGVTCVNIDSDADGYVSCTVRVKGQAEPLAIECASAWSPASGCRMQKIGVRR